MKHIDTIRTKLDAVERGVTAEHTNLLDVVRLDTNAFSVAIDGVLLTNAVQRYAEADVLPKVAEGIGTQIVGNVQRALAQNGQQPFVRPEGEAARPHAIRRPSSPRRHRRSR